MRKTKSIRPILFALGRDDEMNLFVAIETEPFTDQDEWFRVKPDEKLILELRSFLKRLKENPEERISDEETWASLSDIEACWEGMQGATAEELGDPEKYPFEKVMARIADYKKNGRDPLDEPGEFKMSLKLGKQINPKSQTMECKVCGQRWQAQQEPDAGRFKRGSWQCPYGCTQEDLKNLKKKSVL